MDFVLHELTKKNYEFIQFAYSLVVEDLKRGEPGKNLKKAEFGTIRK